MKTKAFVTATAAAILFAQSAHAQQIITAINSDDEARNIFYAQMSSTSGEYVGKVSGSADVHAQTQYGVSKVYGSASDGIELAATSAWLDTFTVQGNAGDMVHLSFTFTVDGSIGYAGQAPDFNFKVFALRGPGWSLNGYGGTGPSAYTFNPFQSGEYYDQLYFQRNAAGAPITQFSSVADDLGMFNYANNGGAIGTFQSNVHYDEGANAYSVKSVNGLGQILTQSYYDDRRETRINDVLQPAATTYYNAGNPAATQAQAGRVNLQNSYSLLDSAEFCPNDVCAQGSYLPTPVTISFDALAGTSFALSGIMVIDSLYDGTVDFFNTARLSGIEATNLTNPDAPVTLFSAALDGILPTDGGQPVYTPALSQAPAVPEPASWAMMIGGLGLVGARLRRRQTVAFA